MASSIKLFPIVAIGASAGGIEALTSLFENLSPQLGMAYVVIQHLSPTHESILPELIERKTKMEVHQVSNGIELKPNCIFVIPPNALMSIEDGHLIISPHVRTDGHNHSIDFFLAALAEIYQEKAIAVILSGTASDGTEGVRLIKSAGGITFAQDKSAKFFSMPHNAIDSGFVDKVLSPKEIAHELEGLSKIDISAASAKVLLAEKPHALTDIFTLINNKYNIDFSSYKPNTITRRIFRRMNLNKIKKAENYVALLQSDSNELDMLYNDFLINVTSFFRDPELYESLEKKIFPELFSNRQPAEVIRIWIPACASGEEPCSVAISLFEYLGDKALITPIQIFATDLSEQAIQKARTGTYARNLLKDVSPERLSKFFVKVDDAYQVIKPIRDVCIYATHNLLSDPPFSRMDIISCQNVMIYLETAAQQKILQSFHYALKSNGFLLLGKSEGVSNANELFTQLEKGLRIFTKTSNPSNLKFEYSLRPSDDAGNNIGDKKFMIEELKSEADIGKEADKMLLARFVPASVVINRDFHIVRFNGETANYLQPASGKASLHVLKMVKDEIVFELRTLLTKAKKNSVIVKKEDIPINIGGIPSMVTIEVIPIRTSLDYYLIVFQEKAIVPVPILKNRKNEIESYKESRITQLEFQLKESKEHLKMMTEEFDFAREQLQSANEEVLSSNEELQSINEELETSKEELQSTNEELTTINEEIQRRNYELLQSTNYSAAIVETIREPLLVLNAEMHVETVNNAFLNHFKIKHADVNAHYFYEVGNGEWNIKELKDKLKEIIVKNKSFENFELTNEFVSIGPKTLLFNAMRLNQENMEKNKYLVVIEDITDRKRAEKLVKANEERLRLIIQNAFDIITIFSETGDILYESESIEDVLGYKPGERIDKNIFVDSIVHPEDMHIKEAMFKNSIESPGKDIRAEFRLLHKNGTYKIMEAVCINLLDNFRVHGLIANYRDITERRMLEKQKDQFIGIASHELKTPVTSIKGYAQILKQIFSEKNDMDAAGMIEKMEAQINRLSNLIKDLLDVTQIGEEHLKLKANTFDINDLLNEVISEIEPTSKKHEIIKKLEPCNKIKADKEKTRQVIINFISNAIKYSPDADSIIIYSKNQIDGITVTVQDFGIGISDEIKFKIFDRFFRDVDPAINTYPGLGLGLYIAAEIIKKQKGKIWVESKKNEGAKFSFFLPFKI